jgi:hypothetical protein
MVVGAVLVISRNTLPLKCPEFDRGCMKANPPTLDEDAIKKKWDRALKRLGM